MISFEAYSDEMQKISKSKNVLKQLRAIAHGPTGVGDRGRHAKEWAREVLKVRNVGKRVGGPGWSRLSAAEIRAFISAGMPAGKQPSKAYRRNTALERLMSPEQRERHLVSGIEWTPRWEKLKAFKKGDEKAAKHQWIMGQTPVHTPSRPVWSGTKKLRGHNMKLRNPVRYGPLGKLPG